MKFLEQEKSPYRIDVCEQCKRYIKTLDERKGGDEKRAFIPSVEDLATMYLDIVAEKEGYERSWFFPSSVDELKAAGESKTLHQEVRISKDERVFSSNRNDYLNYDTF